MTRPPFPQWLLLFRALLAVIALSRFSCLRTYSSSFMAYPHNLIQSGFRNFGIPATLGAFTDKATYGGLIRTHPLALVLVSLPIQRRVKVSLFIPSVPIGAGLGTILLIASDSLKLNATLRANLGIYLAHNFILSVLLSAWQHVQPVRDRCRLSEYPASFCESLPFRLHPVRVQHPSSV